MGVRPGVPDLIVIRDGLPFALELKAEGGQLSAAQSEALEAMRAAGADVEVAHGLDAALRWLTERGILRGRMGLSRGRRREARSLLSTRSGQPAASGAPTRAGAPPAAYRAIRHPRVPVPRRQCSVLPVSMEPRPR